MWTSGCLQADAKDIKEWRDHNLSTAIAVLVRHDRGERVCDKSTERRYWQCEPKPWPSYAVRILNISLGCSRCWHFSGHLWSTRNLRSVSELKTPSLWVLVVSAAAIVHRTFTGLIVLFTFFRNGLFDQTLSTYLLLFFGIVTVTRKWAVVDLLFNTKQFCRKYSSSSSQLCLGRIRFVVCYCLCWTSVLGTTPTAVMASLTGQNGPCESSTDDPSQKKQGTR